MTVEAEYSTSIQKFKTTLFRHLWISLWIKIDYQNYKYYIWIQSNTNLYFYFTIKPNVVDVSPKFKNKVNSTTVVHLLISGRITLRLQILM